MYETLRGIFSSFLTATSDMFLHNCVKQVHQCAQYALVFNVFFSQTVHSHTLHLIKKTQSRDQKKICKFEEPPHYVLNFGISIKREQKTRIKPTKKSHFLSSQLNSKRDNENCSLGGALHLSLHRLKVALSSFSSSWQGRISVGTAFFFLWRRSTFAP